MKKINYVLAKDEDFVSNDSDSFTYIGKEAYVEIPSEIMGVPLTDYAFMFHLNKKIKGVKSTNKNIKSAGYMFCQCKLAKLNLSEFDMTGIESIVEMFSCSSIKNIIWPENNMPLNLTNMNLAFKKLETETLDLSNFDCSSIMSAGCCLSSIKVKGIIFPTKGLRQLLDSYDPIRREPLGEIKTKFHTEELCWAAVLNNKKQGRYVKIKSKRILMYLGTDCPEYIKFYYDEET